MARIEEIDERRVLTLYQFNFQFRHEPTRSEPEIIPHHHYCLDMLTVTLPKSGDQFRVLITSFCMEPLLKLVQDQ